MAGARTPKAEKRNWVPTTETARDCLEESSDLQRRVRFLRFRIKKFFFSYEKNKNFTASRKKDKKK